MEIWDRVMKNRIKKYFGNYELNYYFQPGQWMQDSEIDELKIELDLVNRTSGRNLRYGIFDPSNTPAKLKTFLETSSVCLMRSQGQTVGFFYNVILQIKPIVAIHAGLVMIAANQGLDLLKVPYVYMALLQRKKYGSYYYTNISSTPSIIGAFGDVFSNVWPNYRKSLVRPPNKQYIEILNLLAKNYIAVHFPMEKIEIDAKRFVMKSPQGEMGFEQNVRKLSRYHKLAANLFCIFWLDYTKGEDIIQVGKVDLKFALKINAQLFMWNFYSKIARLFAKNSKKTAGTEKIHLEAVSVASPPVKITEPAEKNVKKSA